MMGCTITQGRDIELKRRSSGDRRSRSFPNVKYWGRRGRRCEIRRYGDQQGAYLDWYPAHLMWTTLATLCLCSIDAIFTLALLQQGAVELNPFMAMLINTNIALFVGVKMSLTTLALVYLVIHHNFTILRIIQVRQSIYGLMFLYLGLVVYESLLLAEPFLTQ